MVPTVRPIVLVFIDRTPMGILLPITLVTVLVIEVGEDPSEIPRQLTHAVFSRAHGSDVVVPQFKGIVEWMSRV